MKLIYALIAAASLVGCATNPVPVGYDGPTVKVVDSGSFETGTTAQLFAVIQVNGNRVENAFGESAMRGAGQGFAVTPWFTERRLPAKPMKVTLRGSHATGAPIQAIAMQVAGTFYSVEGTVDFNPSPGGRYVVKGNLSKDRSSVWIENAQTGERATDVVTKP